MQMQLNGALTLNERRAYTVAETEDHYVEIVPMLFNHRLVLTPKRDTACYDAGWCYPNLPAAVAAVINWATDPAAEEPAGYLKRAI